MEDSRIVELFFERSENAITESAKKYGKYCHYIAYSILYSNEDAEECVNDTYMKAWCSIPPQRQECDLPDRNRMVRAAVQRPHQERSSCSPLLHHGQVPEHHRNLEAVLLRYYGGSFRNRHNSLFNRYLNV